MRVDEFTLANFKCFEDRTFQLKSRFNLVVGANGKGKTTLLDGLAVGLGSLFLGLPSPAKQRGIHKDDVAIRFFRHPDTTTKEAQFPSSVTTHGEVFGQTGQWQRVLTSEGGKTKVKDARWINDLAKEAAERVKKGDSNVLPVIAYYGTGRLWDMIRDRKVETTGTQSRLMGYLDCLNPKSDEKRLIEWFKTKEMGAVQKDKTNPTLEACRKAIVACVPGASNVYFDIDEDRLMLQTNGSVTPFYHLSDGYRNTLAMVAVIAVRTATLNPALGSDAIAQTPGVILIDEIDLHLHPFWQRQVIEDLMKVFPKIQFVATTHSPFIIQSLPFSEEVALLNLDGNDNRDYANMSIEDVAEAIQGLEIPQRSHRWIEMKEAAVEYYTVLDKAESASAEDLQTLKRRLDELSMPFSDDPAYQALLQSERIASGIDDGGKK